MRARSLLAAALLLAGAPVTTAWAEGPEKGPCERFAWSLERERALFSQPGMPVVTSGAELPAGTTAAVLRLRPAAEVSLPIPPERPVAAAGFAGFVLLAAPARPGTYQVTISEEAWVDLSHDGAHALRALGHTGRRGCPGLRKSVRFDLKSEPILVQISNAESDVLNLAISPAE